MPPRSRPGRRTIPFLQYSETPVLGTGCARDYGQRFAEYGRLLELLAMAVFATMALVGRNLMTLLTGAVEEISNATAP